MSVKRHLVFSYHTCPLEEPGEALAGGMNIYLRGLLPELTKFGWEIDVVASWYQDEQLEFREPPTWGWQSEAAQDPDQVAPVRVTRIGCRPKGVAWTREQATNQLDHFANLVRDRIDMSRYTSASAHYWMSAAAAEIACPELPVTLCYHTIQGNKPGRPEEQCERMKRERRLAQSADAIVFNSIADLKRSAPWLSGSADLANSNSFRVIRPGLSTYFTPRPRPIARDFLASHLGGGNLTGKLVVMAARQDPIKRVDLALTAIRTLRAQALNVSLLVVGQPLPEEPGIYSMETVPHEQMPWVFAAADMVLCPSDYESFGLTVLEACSSGVPVLVPEASYWARIIENSEAGLVVRGSGWAEAIQTLLNDPMQSARVGLSGRVLSRSFSWGRAARCWDRLISGH
jgi:D-inositol-3-phosphate glycosyltransferase